MTIEYHKFYLNNNRMQKNVQQVMKRISQLHQTNRNSIELPNNNQQILLLGQIAKLKRFKYQNLTCKQLKVQINSARMFVFGIQENIKSKLMQKGITKEIDPINTIIELYTNIIETVIDYMNREEEKSSKVSFVEEKKNRLCPICQTSIEQNRLNIVRKYIDETWVTGLTLQPGDLQNQEEEINPDDIFSNMEDQEYIKTIDKILSNKKAYKYKTSHTSTVLEETFKINLQKKTEIINMSFNDKDIKSAKDAMDYALGMLNSEFKGDLIEKLVPILMKLIMRFHYSQKQKHKQSFSSIQIQTDQFAPLKKLKLIQEKAQILHRNLYYKQNQTQELKKTIKKLQAHGQIQSEENQEEVKKLRNQNLEYKEIKKTLELDIKKLEEQVAKLQKHLKSMQIIEQRRSSKRSSMKILEIIRLQELQDEKDQRQKRQRGEDNQNQNQNELQNQPQNQLQNPKQQPVLQQHNTNHPLSTQRQQPHQKINISLGQGQGAQRKKSKLFRSKQFMHRLSKSKELQQQNTQDVLDMNSNSNSNLQISSKSNQQKQKQKQKQKPKNTIILSPKIRKSSKNNQNNHPTQQNLPPSKSDNKPNQCILQQQSQTNGQNCDENIKSRQSMPQKSKQKQKISIQTNTDNDLQIDPQTQHNLIQNSHHQNQRGSNHLNKNKNRNSLENKISNNNSLKKQRESGRNSKDNKKKVSDIKNKENRQDSFILQNTKIESKKLNKKQKQKQQIKQLSPQNTFPSPSLKSSIPPKLQPQPIKTQQQIYNSLRQTSKQSSDSYTKHRSQACDYLHSISDTNKFHTQNNSFEYNQSFIKPVNTTIHTSKNKNIFKSSHQNKTIKHSRYPSEINKTIHNSSREKDRISNVQTLYSSPQGTKRQSIIGKPFNSKDLKDMFGSVQEAYHFQSNRQNKPKNPKISHSQTSQKPSSLPIHNEILPSHSHSHQKELLTNIYQHITLLKKKLPQLYDWIKNFLKFPYQTAINNNTSPDLVANLSENTFSALFSRILSFHTQCKNSKNKNYCEHVRGFLLKIKYREEENDKGTVVLPNIQKRNEG